MKHLFLMIAIISSSFHLINAQEFEKFNTLSIYGGIQNPKEIALLDLSGYGPGDYFNPGGLIGMEISREWKRTALSFQANYMRNSINDNNEVETEKSNLTSFSINSKFWVSLLKPTSKFRLKMGIGIGVIPFRHPKETWVWYYGEGIPNDSLTIEPYNGLSGSINSGIVLFYNLNKKFNIYVSTTNDFVGIHGDYETAILSAFSAGISFRL